ncbi:hypothetical protein BEWA_048290 [Theileria equi strain WA]|uniref:Uncharacterized protein n=1 Tax=Theileria equi strain WA TaxID=1537102 RepID=L1LA87_THEEQ|nr:hypothetical protein BEWA_048290 [Theileria equi strain WA]EKX72362.1 hypothetical protein BEWA_048290 [Theileria equi strain WA]|eukprot:XP_004831814.1 hypothetical protein BEWA_048290 [Theileria equi strain WA]
MSNNGSVNIGNNYSEKIYADACQHVINISRRNDKPTGYKQYIHTLPKGNWNSGSYYLGGIHHNGTIQYGFKYIRSCHTNVVVYYWSHDEDNFCPLLIRVRKTWLSWNSDYYYEYYIPTGIGSNKWKRLDQGNNVYSRLTNIINNGFRNIVALKLDAPTNESYYANGDPNQAPDINSDVKIQVSGPGVVHTDYNKYTHRLEKGGLMNILCTKHQGKHKSFKQSVLGTTYDSASVFYSKNDTGRKKPLILQLGYSDFYRLDGEKWVKDTGIKSSELKTALEKENGAHIINISEGGQYSCSSLNCRQEIQVTPSQEGSHHYIRKRHHLQNVSFSVSSFVGSSKKSQTGLSSPTDINEVNVFWHPLNDGKPLLIQFSAKWYKKTKEDNEWEEVKEGTDKPKNYTDTGNKEKIKKLLQKIDQEIKQLGLESRSEGAGEQDQAEESDDEVSDQSILPTILWSTFGSGLGGSAIGVTIWKWPTIMSFLITRV